MTAQRRKAHKADTVLERTKQAIDSAQRNGRNQACSHPELVRQGLLRKVAHPGSVDAL